MESQIERITENQFKIIDLTPTETVLNVQDLLQSISSSLTTIDEYTKKIAELRINIADKQSLIDKVNSIPAPIIEVPDEPLVEQQPEPTPVEPALEQPIDAPTESVENLGNLDIQN